MALRGSCSSTALSVGLSALRNRPAPARPHPQPLSPHKANLPNMALPPAAVPAGCSCSAVGLSMATRSEELQHGLANSHRCVRVCLLQHGPVLGPGAFRGAPAVALAQPRPQTLGDVPALLWPFPWPQTVPDVPVPPWTHPQVTVPLARVHTGVPACPVQQLRNSSAAPARGQPSPLSQREGISSTGCSCSRAEGSH